MSRMTDYCDIQCDECSQWKEGTETGTAETRAILKRDGWTTRYGVTRRLEDICPACNGTKPHYWGFNIAAAGDPKETQS